MRRVLLAVLFSFMSSIAFAQSWTKPVNLGPTSSVIPPQLVMNHLGAAVVAFGYTPASTNVGGIEIASITGSQPWKPAVLGFTAYDVLNLALGLDASGLEYLAFTAGQYDTYRSAFVGCSATSPGIYTGCNLIGANVSAGPHGQVVFADPAGGPVPVLLDTFGCALKAVDTSGGSGLLNAGSDCTKQFTMALSSSGGGAAIFSTKSGAVAAAIRNAGGTWSATTTFATGATLPPVSVAAASAVSGETRLGFVYGKVGSKSNQVFTVTVSPGGALGTPVLQTAAACATSLALTARPDGGFDLLYGAAGNIPGNCEIARAIAGAGAAFAAGAALTNGAHLGTLAAAETTAGNLAILYTDTAKKSLMATTSSSTGFTPPVRLSSLATPVVQAGGGYVNAAWCTSACFAATLQLP